MNRKYDALALLSGGLDSILAMRTVMDQGLAVLGLHFTTPFFGKPHLIPFWREHYGIEVEAVDIDSEFVAMLLGDPSQGFGKWLNPCIDCKITMLGRAAALLPAYGAKFLISGEVVGQRPMSQRSDALNVITKRAGVRDLLLRPLCARNLPPTPMEESGLVDRDGLLDWRGRGRKPQYELAGRYGFTEIPTPAGGCCLTEVQGSARFARLLMHRPEPEPVDFRLARAGRQLWAGSHWLAFGRKAEDNDALESCVIPGDYVFRLADFPGPLAVARPLAGEWDAGAVHDAAALVASYATRARRHFEATGQPVRVVVRRGVKSGAGGEIVAVAPSRDTALPWAEPQPAAVGEWKKNRAARPSRAPLAPAGDTA
ncbi:tRNA(5-methylaminomethyl-2-thiouridylate) methyltransferase [Pseudodesulfovibrio sp. F-1]|uniref:tRNA(5-methylaminomethyl-2-thiouridylate) methyltransferase n=1 Tax=Pseudodesulfovibrio alkaliphilus TaxID=2661613 RepID=A0A7K1KK95_9BACT|nr:tRNA(5-methylaminomethyl-2-thiouridylate) methyltransferase [Pseudodesulfovibrio alkaliphilus]MUM76475.1 tRNA(5-methylaminomethyl-2-thiouridylate) methyltransferase [Pseudodesulfovibrio alkaliphilus]